MNRKPLLFLLILITALAAAGAQAQTKAPSTTAVITPSDPADPAQPVDTVTTTKTVQTSGTVDSAKTGMAENVAFTGPLVINTYVVNDPDLGPSTVVQVDGKGLAGSGTTSKTAYRNGCEAILTRPFAARDHIELSFTFFDEASDSYLRAKTALVTLDLTFDTTTKQLTSATGVVSALTLPAEPTPTTPTPTTSTDTTAQ
jgi:hypothetical protein